MRLTHSLKPRLVSNLERIKCDLLVSKFCFFKWVNLCRYARELADRLGNAAANARAATEKAAKNATEAADRAAARVEERMMAQMERGNDERIKRAQKHLATEQANVEKARATKEAAEAKAVAAGVSPAELAKLAAAAKKASKKNEASGGGKGGASGSGGSKAAMAIGGKSVTDIMKEPECPSEQLPQHMLTFSGDTEDRHKLMAWKKDVERYKVGGLYKLNPAVDP
jgi:hypothetical protein